ncbi:MAG: anthranilate phosphoribosyltransferase [Candidatus Omnitrophota bacterium]|nr:anthranilate phosphoribosyltransferase [Candidatus Omnitrophota bacterium]
MIREAIKKVSEKKNLDRGEMVSVFNEIMSGRLAKEDVKSFLRALSSKGESPEEIAAAAEIMREKAVKIETPIKDLVDTCGTGGAGINDVNVSTITAVVLAGAGVKVAKHGNRSFTGKCGSADILEELGVNINITPDKVIELIDKVNFGFIFAPNFHPAMKNVMEARKELAIRTIFNIIGPLSNPAGAAMQILGVYKPELTEVMAEALNKLGSKKAYIVHGLEGLDEISIKGRTKMTRLEDGNIETCYVTPEDFGMKESPVEEIIGGSREYNAGIALNVLNGKEGAPRDMVLVNAGAALTMFGRAGDFRKGVKIAAGCIDSGKALEALKLLKKLSNQ